MSKSQQLDHDELIQRISRDLADSYDEELEMEIEDRHPLPDAPVRDDVAFAKDFDSVPREIGAGRKNRGKVSTATFVDAALLSFRRFLLPAPIPDSVQLQPA